MQNNAVRHDTADQTQVHAQISVGLLTGSKAEATVSEIVRYLKLPTLLAMFAIVSLKSTCNTARHHLQSDQNLRRRLHSTAAHPQDPGRQTAISMYTPGTPYRLYTSIRCLSMLK
jgi:hypothetical protein